MSLPRNPQELAAFISQRFVIGEALPGIRPSSRFLYDGMGKYLRESTFDHVIGETVVVVRSLTDKSLKEIELFPRIIFLLLKEYQENPESEFIQTPTAKLARFLKERGVRTKYPNLHSHESCYIAVVKAAARKLDG